MAYKEIKIYQLEKRELEDYIRKLSGNPMWTIDNAYGNPAYKSISIKECFIKENKLHINHIKVLRDNGCTSVNGLSYKKHGISYPALKELLGLLIYDNGWPNGFDWELV